MAETPQTPGSSGLWQRLGDDFVLMVGNCITEWAAVENWLFKVC